MQQLSDAPHAGTHLLVHCHAGFSRSTAAAILVLAKVLPDASARDLVAELLRIRPHLWPNLRMVELGDTLLNRRGEVVSAVRQLYGILLQRDPGLKQLMLDVGRKRELDIAL